MGDVFNQERLERAKCPPHRIFGARRGVLARGADHHAQLFEHEIGNRDVLAALDRALELTHQQGLRLRRQLPEIVPQPLDRRLAHTPKRSHWLAPKGAPQGVIAGTSLIWR
jgi:hypothetical protein